MSATQRRPWRTSNSQSTTSAGTSSNASNASPIASMKRGTMASRRQKGSVILWKGKRGSVWRIKYTDATGRAVMETVGPAKSEARPDGFTRSDADAELRDRLTRVEKKRWEKPK